MKQTYNDMWLHHTPTYDVEVRDDHNPLIITGIIKKEDLDPKLYVIDYGKHNGKTLVDIFDEDPQYIDFLRDTSTSLLLTQCINNL
jgi:hypothetical protein